MSAELIKKLDIDFKLIEDKDYKSGDIVFDTKNYKIFIYENEKLKLLYSADKGIVT